MALCRTIVTRSSGRFSLIYYIYSTSRCFVLSRKAKPSCHPHHHAWPPALSLFSRQVFCDLFPVLRFPAFQQFDAHLGERSISETAFRDRMILYPAPLSPLHPLAISADQWRVGVEGGLWNSVTQWSSVGGGQGCIWASPSSPPPPNRCQAHSVEGNT